MMRKILLFPLFLCTLYLKFCFGDTSFNENEQSCTARGHHFDANSKTCSKIVSSSLQHDNDVALEKLLSYCKTYDTYYASPSFSIVPLGKNFRATFATGTINSGDTILSIPRDLLITQEMAKDTPLAYIIQDAKLEFSDYSYIYLPVFILDDMEDKESTFQPYYEILPTSFDNIPLFWNKEDLAHLEGSYLLKRIQSNLEDLRRDYELLCQASPEFSRFTLEQFMWAHCIVLTRVYSLTIDGKQTLALVPVADLMNHNTVRQTEWEFNEVKNCFELTSVVEIEKSDELYLGYGKKSNNDLLMLYGFVLEDNTLDGYSHNTFPLEFSIPDNDPQYKLKKSLVRYSARIVRLANDYTHKKTQDAFPYIRVYAAEGDQLDALSDGNKTNFSSYSLPTNPISCENEILVLKLIQSKCKEELAKYPTTLEKDIESLKDMENYPKYSNKRNALVEIKSEKEVLHYYINLADTAIALFQLSWREVKKNIDAMSSDNVLSLYLKNVVATLKWKEHVAQVKPSTVSSQVSSEERFTQLIDWVNGTGSIAHTISVSKFGDVSRGVIANQLIENREILLSVPLEYLITSDMGRKSPVGCLILNSPLRHELYGDTGVYFSVFILQDREDPESIFHPYYNILPDATTNMPTFWRSDELDLLNGSHVKNQVLRRLEHIRNDYEIICKIVPEFVRYSFEEYHLIYELSMSRHFQVKIDGEGANILVPFADMFNHHYDDHSTWGYDSAQKAFNFRTIRQIRAGTHIYTSYGSKCNTRFLINYGFSIENRTEEEDNVNEIRFCLELEEQDPQFSSKLSLIENPKRCMRLSVDYSREASLEVFSNLRFMAASENELNAIINASNDDFSFNIPVKPLSIQNEKKSLEKLMKVCEEYLKDYPTTLEEDLERLKDIENYPSFSNKRNAVIQLTIEKKILYHYINLVNEALPLFDVSTKELKRIMKARYSRKTAATSYIKGVVSTLVYKEGLNRH